MRWKRAAASTHPAGDICLRKVDGFAGKRLLVVEDGILLDDDTRRLLEVLGAKVEVVNRIDIDGVLSGAIDADGIIIDIEVEADTALQSPRKRRLQAFRFSSRITVEASPRFEGYRLCADAAELTATAAGLFGEPRLN